MAFGIWDFNTLASSDFPRLPLAGKGTKQCDVIPQSITGKLDTKTGNFKIGFGADKLDKFAVPDSLQSTVA